MTFCTLFTLILMELWVGHSDSVSEQGKRESPVFSL